MEEKQNSLLYELYELNEKGQTVIIPQGYFLSLTLLNFPLPLKLFKTVFSLRRKNHSHKQLNSWAE